MRRFNPAVMTSVNTLFFLHMCHASLQYSSQPCLGAVEAVFQRDMQIKKEVI